MEQNKKQVLSYFLVLLALSFLLRLIRLNQGFWYDELYTLLRFIFAPWKEIILSLPVPNNHILYSLLAKLSIKIFGLREWSVRLPSFLIGGITPAVLYLFFRKQFGDFISLTAGLLMALSFWMVWFSQDARGYAGFILFSGLSNLFYLEWLKDRTQKTAFWYVLCSVISFYFYFYTGFIIAGQLAYGLFSLIKNRKSKKFYDYFLPLIPLGIALGLYSPGFESLYNYSQIRGKDITGRWLDLVLLKDTLKLLTGSHWLYFSLCVFLLFLLGLFRVNKIQSGLIWLYFFSAFFLLSATFFLRIFIYARFLAFLIPFYYLGLGSAIELISDLIFVRFSQFKKIYLRIGLIIVFAFFVSISLVRYYHLGKQGFKTAAKYINQNYPARDVISYGVAGYEYLYYDSYAKPYLASEPLRAEDLREKLVVASHRWSWSPRFQRLVDAICTPEKVFKSAGDPDYDVYIFRCFER